MQDLIILSFILESIFQCLCVIRSDMSISDNARYTHRYKKGRKFAHMMAIQGKMDQNKKIVRENVCIWIAL